MLVTIGKRCRTFCMKSYPLLCVFLSVSALICNSVRHNSLSIITAKHFGITFHKNRMHLRRDARHPIYLTSCIRPNFVCTNHIPASERKCLFFYKINWEKTTKQIVSNLYIILVSPGCVRYIWYAEHFKSCLHSFLQEICFQYADRASFIRFKLPLASAWNNSVNS